jgi:hypothetical protein
MQAMAQAHGFTIHAEECLPFNRARGLYIYMVHSSVDLRERKGNTTMMIDADTGAASGCPPAARLATP